MQEDTPTLEDRVLAIKLRIAQFKAEHPGLYTTSTTSTTAHTSSHTTTTSTNTTARTATTSIKDKLNSIR